MARGSYVRKERKEKSFFFYFLFLQNVRKSSCSGFREQMLCMFGIKKGSTFELFSFSSIFQMMVILFFLQIFHLLIFFYREWTAKNFHISIISLISCVLMNEFFCVYFNKNEKKFTQTHFSSTIFFFNNFIISF